VAEDGGEKTEAASARRLQQARGEGNVPLSRDLAGLASFGVGLAALSLAGPADASRLAVSLRYFLPPFPIRNCRRRRRYPALVR